MTVACMHFVMLCLQVEKLAGMLRHWKQYVQWVKKTWI